MVCPRGRGLVENEEQDENKMMKSIVVEEQEQEQEQDEGSETGFVDLDLDTLHEVLKRVDLVTLGRAACVNKLWRKAARDDRLWEPLIIRFEDRLHKRGLLWCYNGSITVIGWRRFQRLVRARIISNMPKPPPDFYSIDFSKMIRPWR